MGKLSAQQPALEWVAELLKTAPHLQLNSHRMSDGSTEHTAVCFRSELMPCELIGSMRSHPGSNASEEGVEDEPRYSENELQALQEEGKAWKTKGGTYCCATVDRRDLANAVAELKAGVFPASEKGLIQDYIRTRAALLSLDELLPASW